MTNGSWRTALYALILTLGLLVVSAPSEAQNATTEDAVGSFLTMTNNRGEAGPAPLPVVGVGTGPLLPVLPVYVARVSKDKGLCPACTARVVPEPGMLALIGVSLVGVGIFVRRRLLDREGESETA